jgi:murein L,D-transpeptidase YcbB/YkuD
MGLAVFWGCAAPQQPPVPAPVEPPAPLALQGRIDAATDPANPAAVRYGFHSPGQIREFYQMRAFEPAWVGSANDRQPLYQLLTVVGESRREGLNPDDYHLRTLTALVRQLQRSTPVMTPQARVRLECLATDAFFTYARHALFGRVIADGSPGATQAGLKEADLIQFLQSALEADSVAAILRSLVPNHAGYTELRRELARYRAFAASSRWPSVPAGPPLKLGDHDERVPILRMRLQLEGFTNSAPAGAAERFDTSLKRAVATFQQRHGLSTDGIVGPATRDALNVSVFSRIEQIALNLERWRWLPRFLGHRYLFVNIANFELQIIEDRQRVLAMRAIVGRNYRQTPIFSALMTTVVLNPYWYVPQTIFVEDLLPKIKADPAYLTARNYKIFSRMGPEAAEVNPNAVDWDSLANNHFPYVLRKEPGPGNPLGRVKFIFPNPFDVYIHDTPSPLKFRRNRRDFSSGCIRIEKPIDLTEYLVKGDPYWMRARISTALETRNPTIITLADPIPVHIVYMTAWAERRGGIQFREDIYDRDAELVRRLNSNIS